MTLARSAVICKSLQVASPSTYLTTRELAELLRIKERKVYDLAASGEVPCSRAMGKLLFPRREIDAWLAANSTGFSPARVVERPNVFLGSHDPLLEWALRQSQCGLAMFFDGSLDGLDRFASGEGIATGLHIFDPQSGGWNVPQVSSRFAGENVVLVEWAERQRGLIIREDDRAAISGLEDLRGRRVVPRQAEAGTQHLFEHLLAKAGLKIGDLDVTPTARTESDAALAVLEGRADAAFGLAAMAAQYRLAFVPVVSERFDLLVDRRAWFEPPMQGFLEFCRGPEFTDRAATMPGYDLSGFGRVRHNA